MIICIQCVILKEMFLLLWSTANATGRNDNNKQTVRSRTGQRVGNTCHDVAMAMSTYSYVISDWGDGHSRQQKLTWFYLPIISAVRPEMRQRKRTTAASPCSHRGAAPLPFLLTHETAKKLNVFWGVRQIVTLRPSENRVSLRPRKEFTSMLLKR